MTHHLRAALVLVVLGLSVPACSSDSGASSSVSPGPVAVACTLDADCGAGRVCGGGTCRTPCDASKPCAAPSVCVGAPGGVPSSYCTTPCHLFDSASCLGGHNCIWGQVGGTTFTDCIPSGNGTGPGGCPSGSPTSCAPGYGCINYDASLPQTSCEKHCRVGSDADCDAGDHCSAFETQAIVDGVEIGHCSHPCDLANPSIACGSGATCVGNRGDSDCARSAGDGVGASTCPMSNASCAPGYYCDTSGDCIRWCDLAATSGCGPGGTCQELSSPFPSNGHNYGGCK